MKTDAQKHAKRGAHTAPKPVIIKSEAPGETAAIGERIGRILAAGDIVALFGDLGSGKTVFVKGIAKGLEVPGADVRVTSPTFALIHEYQGRERICHIDWYRLGSVGQTDAAMAEECFDSGGVTLVEWAERGVTTLPPERLEVRVSHAGVRARTIRLEAVGKKYGRCLDIFRQARRTAP